MADVTAPIQRGRPFKQGQSGNAKGKPPRARHAALLDLPAIQTTSDIAAALGGVGP